MKFLESARETLLLSAVGIALISPVFADDAAGAKAADVGTEEELKLPGLTVFTAERYVDIKSKVCLDAGFLELVATTEGGKEHEAIISISAKPSHVHAALLLLRANPGNPAMGRRLGDGRFLDVVPKGQEVEVFLVTEEEGKARERPISDFLRRAEDEQSYRFPPREKPPGNDRFPTNTFLFAGSQMFEGEDGKVTYLSDQSGNVISLSSFGDELLCLPGKHSQENTALAWEIDPEHLPPLGTEVILRLKPKPGVPAEKTVKP